MPTENETLPPADAGPVERVVGRPEVKRAMRPVCWYCNGEIHPLDDMHHLWCHGGNP